VASSSGSSAANAVGLSLLSGMGSAAGVGSAQATSQVLASSRGIAAGTCTVNAYYIPPAPGTWLVVPLAPEVWVSSSSTTTTWTVQSP
jgi:hypothetical protein